MLEREEARLRAGRMAESHTIGHGEEGLAEARTSTAATAKGPAATAAAAAQEMMQSLGDAEFQCAVEVLYHGARRDFFLAMHRWAMFLVVLFGAAAVPDGLHVLAGFLAAGAGAADLAFDFNGRAQAHADVRRRYFDLTAKVAGGMSDEDFGREWLSVSADEPPLYRDVELLAIKWASIALGREVPTACNLPMWRRLRAHFWRG